VSCKDGGKRGREGEGEGRGVPVVHGDNILLGLEVVRDEAAVDVDLAKLILNHCNLLAVPAFHALVRQSFFASLNLCKSLSADKPDSIVPNLSLKS
jgi:hypothetical protein